MWQVEDNFDTFLAKDVDLAWAVVALVGADSEEGLDRVVCDLTDFA